MTKLDIEIQEKKISISIPSTWDELSFEQYSKILEANEKYHNVDDICIAILAILIPKKYLYIIDIPKHEFEHSSGDKLYYAGIIEDLVKLVYDFVQSPKEIVNPNFDKIIIRNGFKANSTFYGPDVDMAHLRLNEYGLVENAIKNFSDSNDYKYLYEMAAILYRPKIRNSKIYKLGDEYEGDLRSPYSELDFKQRVDLFKKKLNKFEVLAIKDWYNTAHKINFEDAYPFVFKKKIKSNFDFEAPQNDYAVAGMVLEMAGAKWGLVPQVYKQYCHNIFLDLNRINEKMEEENLNRILQ